MGVPPGQAIDMCIKYILGVGHFHSNLSPGGAFEIKDLEVLQSLIT
jgi:hypothetical protein